jgi:hypothetical protein
MTWDGKRVKDLDERDRKDRWMIMLVTVAALLTFKNDAVGFVTGLAWHWGFVVARRIEDRRTGRTEGHVWRSVGHSRDEGAGLLAHTESDTVA